MSRTDPSPHSAAWNHSVPNTQKLDLMSVTKRALFLVTAAILTMTESASSAVIDDIKADMQQLHEATLLNAPDNKRPGGALQMGNAPRGDATPTYWTPDNLAFKSATPWTAIAPWFVLWPSVDHAATNVRVKVYRFTVFVLKKSTNQWGKIDTGSGNPKWAANFDFTLFYQNMLGSATPRTEPDGTISYKLNDAYNPIHGSHSKHDLTLYVDPLDIAAVFISVKTQLILDDPLGIDDRASAKITLTVGADYYPSMTTKITDFSPLGYVPMVAGSRFGLVKTTPRTHYMATIDPPGTYPSISVYTQNGGKIAIPDYQLEANMPPITPDTTTSSTLDTTAPSIAITSPGAGSTVSGNVSVQTNATDNVGVSKVELLVNGALVASSNTSPFTLSWNSKTVPNGSVSLSANAYDAAGNKATSSAVSVNVNNPDITPPVVTLTSPANGATVGSSVTITSTASDDRGSSGITQFLYIDGSLKATVRGANLSYNWSSSGNSAGKGKLSSHTISVTAKDAAGNSSTKSISVFK